MKIKVNELKHSLVLNTQPGNKTLCYKEALNRGESIEIFAYKNLYSNKVDCQIWLNYNNNKDCTQVYEYQIFDINLFDSPEYIKYLVDNVRFVYKKIYE